MLPARTRSISSLSCTRVSGSGGFVEVRLRAVAEGWVPGSAHSLIARAAAEPADLDRRLERIHGSIPRSLQYIDPSRAGAMIVSDRWRCGNHNEFRGATPSRPRLDPVSTPSRPRLDPVSTPSGPR